MLLKPISVALLAALLSSGAIAEQLSSPSVTTASYDAWTARCAKVETKKAGGGDPVCELVQTAKLRQTGQPILQVALGRFENDERFQLVFVVPNLVYLRDQVTLAIDEEADETLELKASFFRCGEQSCVADVAVDEHTLNQFLAASSASVSFTDGALNPIRIPLSMNGLISAFTATFSS